MSSPSSPPAFRLETSDGGQEDGAQVDKGKLGGGAGPPPMESPFQGEDRNFSPQIKVNLSFRKGAGASQPDPNRFDRDRLFSVVARGVPEDLVGLPEYLRRTSKYLTDSEYTEGSTGKTCLMKAVLNLRDGTNACIEPLLQIDRDLGNPRPLVNAQCTDEYYRGHSALHIAIEKRSLPCVKLLVENGADVHARACGQFFQKKSQETCFYFGEMPLSLAACTKQWDVVTYLLENPHQPASLQAADSLGNTALHALVMIADDSAENTEMVTRMYDGLLQAGARLCPTVRLEDIPNLQGLTPLKLAAKEGKIEILRHILQREFAGPCQSLSRKFTEWSYGPVRVSLYDLASVDSWEENSVLEIIAFHCQSPHRHRMVVLEPLNKLLQAKWNLLIPRFLFNFLCYLTYMSIFTAVTYHQPALDKDFLPLEGTAGNSMLLLGHILMLLVGANILMGQLWYFWRRRLFIWISFMDSYFEILFLVQALLTVLSQVLRFLAIEWHLPLLVCSLALGWLNLLYYTRGLQHTGIYSVMIQKVILRDLLRFLLVYLVFLFGFAVGKGPPSPTHSLCPLEAARWSPQAEDPLPISSALVSLSREARDPGAPAGSNTTEVAGKGDAEGSTAPYEGVLDASLELFKFTIGMGELAVQAQLRFRGVALLLLLTHVLLTYVLLLNMLVALMSETVSSVASDSWSIWKLQKAISVLEMENGYWWCRRKKQRAGVRLTVGTRPDGLPDERWCFRVEEVNWAAWEQTLPTVREEPSGPGGPGALKNPALASQSSQDSAVEEDHVPLQLLESH
ncbi:transient receptor potential cation channel subfamily V member 2 isoform X1 [Lagenorhynchus albirostris]|uniref:transient receptor potential cation channel subfamily V member 2 isoform X1 n=1 Tax=Lagenorhynchus albirostris TaxID=27610 RepID=UPI0028E27F7F|nr:transient receptor potential cation channel subfamily V member 2 isoform X1 [Lagenorhynchus albirostris]XP_059991873.1 transient receptor potential cation channel subfamily V member 2 isoform X1 [Lagenorhynchus albirostris]XP_059991875.1 transient receptor potential cation channel subfamily V member 2 isoform X1 [Lagenorhynchus albirostris]XP_059991876.1 transient receptor potential cation channel subfamily V member 2 isoform X1 [Lagenorhynchus albirostris]